MVERRGKRKQFCGATLVASKYVVTAAHCMFMDKYSIHNRTTSDVFVRLGELDLSVTGEESMQEKTINVTKIIRHENYKRLTFNDIALLELAEEVDMKIFPPACMARTTDTNTFYGKTAYVYGWGVTSSGGKYSSKLREVGVPVVTPAQCAISTLGTLADGQICAGGEAGKDSCQVL